VNGRNVNGAKKPAASTSVKNGGVRSGVRIIAAATATIGGVAGRNIGSGSNGNKDVDRARKRGGRMAASYSFKSS
jgi:hypothetical protein